MSENSYLRGAFIAYAPRSDSLQPGRVIPFRFNPEKLTRQLNIEQGQKDPGTSGAKTTGAAGKGAADAASGKVNESFQILVRLDYADRHQATGNLEAEYGIAPEIAALEDLLYGAASHQDDSSDRQQPVRQSLQRPTVLFVWGRRRVLPVRITAMTIEETMFNRHLNPVRAEIQVSLEVLQEADARNNALVADALDFTSKQRKQLAKLFFKNTADQGSGILPL
ncbi:MAG TPA: hypothetical protein VNM90_01340 [Haliangium sp.]|nr:hypothetical protein [Haliangium sp.]